MPPKPATPFKGPGHWRSQAAAAQGLDGNDFAVLAEMHRRLLDKGMTEAAAKVARAQQQARAGMVDAASDTLRDVAGDLSRTATGHSQALRETAERIAASRPGTTAPAQEDELPGTMMDS